MTNRKPRHKDANGRSPYLLAHETGGKLAPSADAFLQSLTARQGSNVKPRRTRYSCDASHSAATYYQDGLLALEKRYGGSMDVSRADYMLSLDLARQGFSVAEIADAILQCSPNLDTRKTGHQQDYAQRTARAAFQAAQAALSPTAPAGALCNWPQAEHAKFAPVEDVRRGYLTKT